MTRYPLILGVALLYACSGPNQNSTTQVQPNILLIFIDDLGYGAITPYGNRYQKMPSLEKLASEGMKFTDAYVTPQCTPTRASLMTGQHTSRNGMWHVIPEYGFPYARIREPKYVENLPRDTYTLGKALKDNGYTTAMLGKWHLTANEDGYYTYLYDSAKGHYGFDYAIPLQDPRGYHQKTDKGVKLLTDETMAFMERSSAAGIPFFAYLSQHTIHGPVLAPDSLIDFYKQQGWPYEKRKVMKVDYPSNAVYLAALKHIDNSVGLLLNKVEELGIEENTIVIFLSDNGGEDSEFENFPLRYGKGSAYEGGIRVPFIVKWPGKVSPGSISSIPVHITDLYPTLIEIAGGQMNEKPILDGESIVPVLTGTGLPKRDALYWYMPLYDIQWGATPSAVIREGNYKLIHSFGDHIDLENASAYIPEAKTELYDLSNDLSETTDLAAKMPERTERMKTKLFNWIKDTGAEIPMPNPDYNRDSVFVRGKRTL